MARTLRLLGIEEEFALLDPTTGAPKPGAAAVLLGEATAGNAVEPEFLDSQIEIVTPPCLSGAEAESALLSLRAQLATLASQHGAVLAPTGTPPVNHDDRGPAQVTADPRYELIARDARQLARTHYINGLHVHVSIANREEGVRALNGIARWAPLLLAITGNSAFCNGVDTGFHSWRHIVACAWPLNVYPAPFRSAQVYDRRVARLVSSGLAKDRGLVSWHARLSARYPTIELRIADVQLSPLQSVGFATVVRALVDTIIDCQEVPFESLPETGEVNASIWQAARDGLDRSLVDPEHCQEINALEWIDRLLEFITPALRDNGDLERATEYVKRLRDRGTPAAQQRRSYDNGGVAELLELYTSSHGQASGAAGILNHSPSRLLEQYPSTATTAEGLAAGLSDPYAHHP